MLDMSRNWLELTPSGFPMLRGVTPDFERSFKPKLTGKVLTYHMWTYQISAIFPEHFFIFFCAFSFQRLHEITRLKEKH